MLDSIAETDQKRIENMQEQVHQMIAMHLVAPYCVVQPVGDQKHRTVHTVVWLPREQLRINEKRRNIGEIPYMGILHDGVDVVVMESVVQGIEVEDYGNQNDRAHRAIGRHGEDPFISLESLL